MINDQQPVENQQQDNTDKKLLDRFTASVILGAVGDAIGYCNGSWEFCFNGEIIHKELKENFGSLKGINVRKWRVSDDTVMHLASLRALVTFGKYLKKEQLPTIYSFNENDEESCNQFMKQYVDPIMQEMSNEYILCWKDMGGRAPGPTCAKGVRFLNQKGVKHWQSYEYDSRGGGCGGSMRAMDIGLALYGKERRDMLIAVSIESGRLTHNHPTGFLGALVSALYTAYAIEDEIKPEQWGVYFLYDILPRCKVYLKNVAKRDWKYIEKDLNAFVDQIETHLKERNVFLEKTIGETAICVVNGLKEGSLQKENLTKEQTQALKALEDLKAIFPEKYGVVERDAYYKKFSFNGWAGASGDDSCIVAYDALLCAGPNDYETMMLNSALHGGDSDSTGTIAAAWYGALYGWNNVFESNWKEIEKKEEMIQIAKDLFDLYKL
ncbi:hypothetical protein ABK040_010388 [Willaertia magna]